MKFLELEKILQSQGVGSRKVCRELIRSGCVYVNAMCCDDPHQAFPTQGFSFDLSGEAWDYQEKLYIVLHKPSGYECSRAPHHYSSVFSLLPDSMLRRGVQPVGRLDQDTTGLLLLTDDGVWSHALMSPRKHIEKTYRVTLKHQVTQQLVAVLLSGVQLHDESELTQGVACRQINDYQLDLTIAEGKYHQVKRMLAAAGNRVEKLHRLKIGSMYLPDDLIEGEWRYLSEDEQCLCSIPLELESF